MTTTMAGDEEIALNWLRDIAGKLSAARFDTRLHTTRAGSDLTVTLHHPGRREMEALIDDDGYIELRYWANPAATPAQVAHTIVRAFTIVAQAHKARTESGPERALSQGQELSPVASLDPATGTTTGYDGAVTERAGDGAMPGSKDPPTERPAPDVARPTDTGNLHPELAKRLEQLPHGHPSSPYNVDGTRKPPVPDPFKGELPIEGDPGFHSDTSSKPENSRTPAGSDTSAKDQMPKPDDKSDNEPLVEDEARIGPRGSWEWRGYSLTPEQSRLGDQGLGRCGDMEGRDSEGRYGVRGLTPAMRRIEAALEHGELVRDTEKFALKSADRFKLKLAERISLQPGESAETLVSRIHDGVRYTFEYDDEHYTSGTQETEEHLKESGYELITRKPSWDSPDYKGINSQWRDSASGLFFEIQFHTHASWRAKQATHDAYEKLSDPRTSPEERARLDAYQREITATVPVPPGALEIPYYHKEGI